MTDDIDSKTLSVLESRAYFMLISLIAFGCIINGFKIGNEKKFFVVAWVVPLIFVIKSISVLNKVASERSAIIDSTDEKVELTVYGREVIQPLGVFSEPLKLLTEPPNLKTFLIFEVIIQVITLGFYF